MPKGPNRLCDLPGGIVGIELTYQSGEFRCLALIDKKDVPLLSDRRWCLGNYVMRTYKTSEGKGRTILLHREIMGNPHLAVVDHINGDVLDNRRANLRIVTLQQNQWNRSSEPLKGNPRRGVCEAKPGSWRATISLTFDKPEDAMRQRELWEEATYGEYARQPAIGGPS